MLIKEIKPIDKRGVDLLEEKNLDKVIDEIIELPLRNACKIFAKKGIMTFMSSANKNNVLQKGESPIEKEDIYGSEYYHSDSPPNFHEAGKGYAWIMLDFDTLSDENKDWLFSLEERKGTNGEKIGEKAIWFVHPCQMGNIEYDMKIGKYDYDYLKMFMPEDQIPKNITVDPKLVEFEKRHIILAYGGYSTQTVILRMPINEQTTVEEVDEYFIKFAESFKTQIQEKKKEVPEER